MSQRQDLSSSITVEQQTNICTQLAQEAPQDVLRVYSSLVTGNVSSLLGLSADKNALAAEATRLGQQLGMIYVYGDVVQTILGISDEQMKLAEIQAYQDLQNRLLCRHKREAADGCPS